MQDAEAKRLCQLALYCSTHSLTLKCIQAKQMTVLLSAQDVNSHLNRLLADKRNLFLLLIDPLASRLIWPDLIVHENRLYQRGANVTMPDDLPKHSYFGMRHYEQVDHFDLSQPYSLVDLNRASEDCLIIKDKP